jgi:diguanylate cyclase (GGDEF)-like protein
MIPDEHAIDPDQRPEALADALARISELEQRLDEAVVEVGVLRLQLDMLSSTDTLTGLPNEHGIVEALEKAAARSERSQEPFGLLAIDLPTAERIAAASGAEILEDAFRHGGALVAAGLRRLDTVGRTDGGGFMAVLPMLSREGVDVVLGRIERLLLRTPLDVEGEPVRLMPAFAVVLSNPSAPSDPHEMLNELTAARARARPGSPVVVRTGSAVEDGGPS